MAKEVLSSSRLNNIVDHNENVEVIEPPSIPDEHGRILGFRDRKTRHNVALVKQKDHEESEYDHQELHI